MRFPKVVLSILTLLLAVGMVACTDSSLPYDEVTYNAESGGYIVKSDAKGSEVMSGPMLMVSRDGIGTVVVLDTLRCDGHEISTYESVGEMPADQFSVTAVGAASVLVLDRESARTWNVDLNQCCILFRYADVGTISILADPNCPGLRLP